VRIGIHFVIHLAGGGLLADHGPWVTGLWFSAPSIYALLAKFMVVPDRDHRHARMQRFDIGVGLMQGVPRTVVGQRHDLIAGADTRAATAVAAGG